MQVNTNKKVEEVFQNYPQHIKPKLQELRSLIIDTAQELGIPTLEETLKWGEPSYIAKKGSTIRIDWKEKSPDQYAMYFSCSTTLVPTFRVMFEQSMEFEGKRAIIFNLKDNLPKEELTRCIQTALTYKKVKDLPMLGL